MAVQSGPRADAAEAPEADRSTGSSRFDTVRARIGLPVGPLGFLAVLLLADGLVWPQRALAAVFVLVMVWWVTEALPLAVTAVFAVLLCVFLGVADEETVLGAFGTDTIFVFLGGFVIARAMSVHGLDRRIALRALPVPGIAGSPVRTMIAFGVLAAAISAFVSNTATVAMLLPIGIGIVRSVSTVSTREGGPDLSRSRWATSVMLMIAYGASIGGLITPVGAPHQLIGRDLIESQTGRTIGFVEWVTMFLPIVLVMFVVLAVLLLLLNRPEVTRLEGAAEFVAEQRASLGGVTRGEKNTVVAFGVAVVLWSTPGVLGAVIGEDTAPVLWLTEHVTEGVAAVFAATLLFLLPARSANGGGLVPTLTWAEAVKIDWGVILLFGAGTVLGSMSSETGLARTFGDGIATGLGVSSLVAVTVLAAVMALLVSETTSNTASAGIVVPIVVPIAVAIGVDPLIPGLVATAAAGYGFMLPVSTPPNAIVYGSGLVPLTKMIRSGVVFDIVGVAVLVVGVLLMAPLVGL